MHCRTQLLSLPLQGTKFTRRNKLQVQCYFIVGQFCNIVLPWLLGSLSNWAMLPSRKCVVRLPKSELWFVQWDNISLNISFLMFPEEIRKENVTSWFFLSLFFLFLFFLLIIKIGIFYFNFKINLIFFLLNSFYEIRWWIF